MFVKIKEAFDRVVKLNEEHDGKLLRDKEYEDAQNALEAAKAWRMHEIKMELARAKARRRKEEAKRLE